MRVLFVTSNRVGDAVLSTGLADHLLQTHPEARFTVVCGPAAEGVFTRMPGRERTIVLRKRARQSHWLPLWLRVARRRWDLVVDLRGSALSWMVVTRRRATLRPRPGPKVAQLGAVLGLDPPPLPHVWTAPEDRARAAALLPAGPLVTLAPTANWEGKLWPAPRFAEAFAAIRDAALPGARAVVIGGPGEAERALAAPLLALLPDAIDLVGRLTIPRAAACLARCDLFIGNDSGPMHLAAAAGAVTLGLFGPTPAEIYAPAGPNAEAVRSPTTRMQDIAVDAVVAAALRRLAGPAAPSVGYADTSPAARGRTNARHTCPPPRACAGEGDRAKRGGGGLAD